MRSIKTLAVCAITILTFSFATLITKRSPSDSQIIPETGNGFAVLELFTSEGCSSCPPADKLLARMEEQAGNTPVYLLAYHVDYWDRLGWKDPFSKPEFSKRQYEYSELLNSSVFTPQLIINGKRSFVGSDEPGIRKALKEVLESKTSGSLMLKAAIQTDKLSVDYRGDWQGKSAQLVLALVKKEAVNKVGNGENGGRTLHHVQIVHNTYRHHLTPGTEGTCEIPKPENFNADEWELIGFIQSQGTGEIFQAAKTKIGLHAQTHTAP